MWGVLLAYNLLCSQIEGIHGESAEFSHGVIHELSCMPYLSPGTIPKRVADLEKQVGQFV